VIPYYPLSPEVMQSIIRLQLGRITKRIAEHHKVPFTYDDKVVDLIAARCNEPESGGRMIDAILTNTMLPAISAAFLNKLIEGGAISRVSVSAEDDAFTYEIS
jgi:type VI secretion system protein VasG